MVLILKGIFLVYIFNKKKKVKKKISTLAWILINIKGVGVGKVKKKNKINNGFFGVYLIIKKN